MYSYFILLLLYNGLKVDYRKRRSHARGVHPTHISRMKTARVNQEKEADKNLSKEYSIAAMCIS